MRKKIRNKPATKKKPRPRIRYFEQYPALPPSASAPAKVPPSWYINPWDLTDSHRLSADQREKLLDAYQTTLKELKTNTASQAVHACKELKTAISMLQKPAGGVPLHESDRLLPNREPEFQSILSALDANDRMAAVALWLAAGPVNEAKRTKKDLCAAARQDRSELNRWENNKKNPGSQADLRIRAVLLKAQS